MLLTLTRTHSDQATFGILANAMYALCITLELPWLNNHPQTSCIPPGKYHCVAHNSADHPNTWEITNVPGRSEILLHEGNFLKNTLGCILVGDKFSGSGPVILDSDNTLNNLRKILPPEFDLNIVDAPVI